MYVKKKFLLLENLIYKEVMKEINISYKIHSVFYTMDLALSTNHTFQI